MLQCCLRSGLMILLGIGIGCGDGAVQVKTVPVSGTVVYAGKPVEGATVSFWNKDSPRAASGVTDANGEFKLSMFKLNDGAIPGENVITVAKIEAGSTPVTNSMTPPDPKELAKRAEMLESGKGPKSLIPEKYSSGATTPLKEVVAESGENSFVLQLTD